MSRARLRPRKLPDPGRSLCWIDGGCKTHGPVRFSSVVHEDERWVEDEVGKRRREVRLSHVLQCEEGCAPVTAQEGPWRRAK